MKRPTLCARSRRDLGVISGYGLPSYGAPQPYQTPSSPSDFVSPKSPTVGGQRGGNNKNPGFWSYGAPTNYSVPVDYKAPVKYGSPAAYGQGVGVVEEIKGTELGEEGATLDQVKELEKDAGGGGAGGGNSGSGGGGGQGGGGGDGGNEGGDDGDAKKKMSMSQKLTLAYAILVGGGCSSLFSSHNAAPCVLTATINPVRLAYNSWLHWFKAVTWLNLESLRKFTLI